MMQTVIPPIAAGLLVSHPCSTLARRRIAKIFVEPPESVQSRAELSVRETTTRTLDSMLQAVDSVENDALEFVWRAGFHGTTLEKIGLAVREIVNNAIIHGNRLDRQKKVIVRLARTTSQITITFWDQGTGFDPDSLPDPHSAEALLRGAGRGIYLARAFMDEFHVQPGPAGGTTVILVKNIRGNGRSWAEASAE